MPDVQRTFAFILRHQNDQIKSNLDYIRFALCNGHEQNGIAVLVQTCELIHDAIETIQMQIDQIQNHID